MFLFNLIHLNNSNGSKMNKKYNKITKTWQTQNKITETWTKIKMYYHILYKNIKIGTLLLKQHCIIQD